MSILNKQKNENFSEMCLAEAVSRLDFLFFLYLGRSWNEIQISNLFLKKRNSKKVFFFQKIETFLTDKSNVDFSPAR